MKLTKLFLTLILFFNQLALADCRPCGTKITTQVPNPFVAALDAKYCSQPRPVNPLCPDRCDLPTICSQLCAIRQRLGCENPTLIYSRDINVPGGYVITTPGLYCLAEDVVFDPVNYGTNVYLVQPAITIKSSDVTLSLGSHRLAQANAGSSSQTPFGIGILVPDMGTTTLGGQTYANLENITIQGDNANIEGFSMYGVRIFANVYDVTLRGFTIQDCGILASKALRPWTNYFPHSTNQSAFGPSFGVGGLIIGESTMFGMGSNFFQDIPAVPGNNIPGDPNYVNRLASVYIENVYCLNNFSNGLMLVNATDVEINNCSFDDTFSDDPIVNAFGAFFTNASQGPAVNFFIDPCILNMNVSNSTFNNTKIIGDFTTLMTAFVFAGMGAFDAFSKNIVWENCQFNNTSNTFVGGTTVGCLSNGSEDSTFINCNFDGMKALSAVNGLHRSGIGMGGGATLTKSSRNLLMINCTANNNQLINDQQKPSPVVRTGSLAVGYTVSFAKDVTMINCTAQDNIVNGPLDSTGAVVGFLFSDAHLAPIGRDALSENISLQGCVAARNQTLQGGQAQGFRVFPAQVPGQLDRTVRSMVLEDCESFGNIANVPPVGSLGTQGIGCGFFLDQNPDNSTDANRSFPVSLINCKAYRNKGAQTTGTGAAQLFSAGFFLRNALRHDVTNCEALDNIYGFMLKNCNRCALRENRADNNVDLINPGLVGGGFVDVGATGTPAAPTVSTSAFENNHAFANGLGTVHTGNNGNYNIVYPFGVVPTYNASLTTGYPATPMEPAINISTIQ